MKKGPRIGKEAILQLFCSESFAEAHPCTRIVGFIHAEQFTVRRAEFFIRTKV
jgi:hypothetical protein